MARVKRLICGSAAFVLGLAPLTVSATPSPAPSLDSLLAAPPSGFTELTLAEVPLNWTVLLASVVLKPKPLRCTVEPGAPDRGLTSMIERAVAVGRPIDVMLPTASYDQSAVPALGPERFVAPVKRPNGS